MCSNLTVAWVNVEDASSWWHYSVGNLPILPKVTVSGCYCDDCTACWEVLWYSHLMGNTHYRYMHYILQQFNKNVNTCERRCVEVAVPDTSLEWRWGHYHSHHPPALWGWPRFDVWSRMSGWSECTTSSPRSPEGQSETPPLHNDESQTCLGCLYPGVVCRRGLAPSPRHFLLPGWWLCQSEYLYGWGGRRRRADI